MAARSRGAGSAAGFTLVELIIAMTLMSLISVSLYGLITVGARAASSGERVTEQARRYRIATTLLVRQLRSAAPERAVIEDEEEEQAVPYFLGEESSVEFITSQPQGPNNAGLALVTYWYDDGMLMMSEEPHFLSFVTDRDSGRYDDLVLETPLLYDVESVRFAYQRFDVTGDGIWEDSWDASIEEQLPAGVRVEIEPATDDGPDWYHEVPVYVGVMNEITGEISDFRGGSGPAGRASRARDADDDDDGGDDDDDGMDDDDEGDVGDGEGDG